MPVARRPAPHRARRRHGRGRAGRRGGGGARSPRAAPSARCCASASGPRSTSSAAVSPLAEYRALFDDARADDVLFTVVVRRARCPSACASRPSTRTTARSTAAAAPARSTPAASCGCRRCSMRARATRSRREITVDGLDGIWMPTVGRLASVDFDGRPRRIARRPVLLQRGRRGRRADGRRRTRDRRLLRRPRRRAARGRPRRDRRARRGERRRRGARERAHLGRRARRRARAVRRSRVSCRCCASAATSATGCRRRTEPPRGWRRFPTTRSSRAPPDTRSPASTRSSAACSSARPIRAPRPPATTSPRSATTSSSPWRWPSSPGSSASRRASCVGARLSVGRARPAHVRGRRVPRAGPRGVDRGAVVGRRLGRRRRHAAVRAVAEPRGHRAARPRERHRGAPRLRRGGRSARSGPGGLGRRRHAPTRRPGSISRGSWPVLRIGGARAARPRARLRAVPRRRSARRPHGDGRAAPQGTPAARIAGGWDEYVDAAVDAGREAPRPLTRRELAEAFATPSGAELAETADRAVFSGAAAADEDAAAFWRLVDAERRRFAPRARVLARARRDRIVEIVLPSSGTRRGCSQAFRRKGEAPGSGARAPHAMTAIDGSTSLALTMIGLIAFVALYVWVALALTAVFRKSGEEAWKAWVPVLNLVVLLRLGGLSGWLLLLGARARSSASSRSGSSSIIACHRIGAAFGYGPGMTVLAALLLPVWATVIGFGSSRWVGAETRRGVRRTPGRHRGRRHRRSPALSGLRPPGRDATRRSRRRPRTGARSLPRLRSRRCPLPGGRRRRCRLADPGRAGRGIRSAADPADADHRGRRAPAASAPRRRAVGGAGPAPRRRAHR